ncbi:MAG: RDD family protein [Verrucomicrobiota bacterium]
MVTNYKIIGGDGREYGPVTLDEIKGWIRDGRIGRQTQIWRSDLGTWLAASQYQELQTEISVLKASATGIDGEFEPVGFWPRLGAFIIDSVVIYFVYWLLWTAFVKTFGWSTPVSPVLTGGTFRMDDWMPILVMFARQSALSLLLRFVYEISLNGRFGATLGKMIIGAKIVRADGSPLGYKFAFLRFLGRLVSDLTCYIGYLMVAFREDKRGLHDLIVGTRVIYKR